MKGTCHPPASRGQVPRLPGQGAHIAKGSTQRGQPPSASAETVSLWVRLGNAETHNQALTVFSQGRETRRATPADHPYMLPSNKDGVRARDERASPQRPRGGGKQAHLPVSLPRVCPRLSSDPKREFPWRKQRNARKMKSLPHGRPVHPRVWWLYLFFLSPGPGHGSHLVTAYPEHDSHAVLGSG